jgi:perosamine synthetase
MIPLSIPNLVGNEKKYLIQCAETGWVSTAGSFVQKFEKKISKFTGAKYSVACNSGTSALHLALRVINVLPNEEVIVPTVTFIATINTIKYVSANPIFMDCDKNLNLDLDKLIKFLKEETLFNNGYTINKKTKKKIRAIIFVHVNGNLVDFPIVLKELKKRKLVVIEDAAEALGSFYKLKNQKVHAGLIGDIGCLSFNGNKIITAGNGGMLITNNKKYSKFAKFLSTQAIYNQDRYIHSEIGYNYRLSNIAAAIGVAQLEKINFFLKKKIKIYNFYQKAFKNNKKIELISQPKHINNYWMISILIKKNKLNMNAVDLLSYLKNKNIQTRTIWWPNHLQKKLLHHQRYRLTFSEKIKKNILNLPCSTSISDYELSKVSDEINKIIV